MADRDLHPDQSSTPTAQPEQSGRERNGLPGLLATIWRRKLLILASLLLCIGAGAAYLAITPSRYLAAATLNIDPQFGTATGDGRKTFCAGSADEAAVEDQIRSLTSRTILARVAKQADLANDPEFNGSQRSLLIGVPLDGGVDLGRLKDAITIRHSDNSDLVSIKVLARDPKKAAEIANAVAQAYVADQPPPHEAETGTGTGDDMRPVRQALDTLSGQIRALDKRIDEKAEIKPIQTKPVQTKHLRTPAPQTANLTRALAIARTREADAEARLSDIDRMASQGHLDAKSEALHSPAIERLLQRQTAADQETSRLAKVLGVLHPTMIDAQERRRHLRALIIAELRRLEPSVKRDGESAHAEVARITAELRRAPPPQSHEVAKPVVAKPVIPKPVVLRPVVATPVVPLRQFEEDRDALRASFDRLARSISTLTPHKVVSLPNRIVSMAQPPLAPVTPRTKIVALAAVVAGLLLGLMASLLAGGAKRKMPPVAEAGPTPSAAPPARGRWDDDDDIEWRI